MPNAPDPQPEAVFIGGCPRSGTTLLASLLGALPGCVVTPESQFKQPLVVMFHRHDAKTVSRKVLLSSVERHFRFRQWSLDLQGGRVPAKIDREALRQFLMDTVHAYAKKHGLQRSDTWIDHTPQNIETGLALATIFPHSRIIHIVRDPRAVAASLLPLDWGPHTPAGVARLWARRVRCGLDLERDLSARVMRVRYEDLCATPEKTIRDVAEWAAIPIDPTAPIVATHYFIPAHTYHQHRLVGHSPDPGRINAWRQELASWQQWDIEVHLAELMTRLGYPPDAARPEIAGDRPGVFSRQIEPIFRAIRGKLRHRFSRTRSAGASRRTARRP